MAVTPIRRHERERPTPTAVDGIGPWGWLGVFVVFLVAVLLVAYF
jgi:hypothetical protein